MLLLHLVLLVYVVLNNPFLNTDIDNNMLSQIILINCLVLIGYYVWTQLNKIDVMKIYGLN